MVREVPWRAAGQREQSARVRPPRTPQGWAGTSTHLALEGAALREGGQSDALEKEHSRCPPLPPNAPCCPPMPPPVCQCLQALGGLGLGAQGFGEEGPVVTPWAVGEGQGSYHLFHIIFLKVK